MKKLLILSIFPILFWITSAQYYFFTWVNNYPQECTWSLEVRVNTNSMTPSVSDLYIDYWNDLSYDTSSLANMSLSTFVKWTFFTVPQVDNWLVYDSNYRRLAVFLKGTPHADTNGLMGTINFKPNQKSSAYDTVFSLYLWWSTDTNTSLWLNWVDILDNNMPQQLQKSVYTWHVVQTPCMPDKEKPEANIFNYDGDVIKGKTKISVKSWLFIPLTDNNYNWDTPLVFDEHWNWVQNTQWITNQYWIDLEKSKITITKENQPILTAVPLSDLVKYANWTVELQNDTWRWNGEKLNALIRVDGDTLKNTPLDFTDTTWFTTHQIGIDPYEWETIWEWWIEKQISIKVDVVDRAKNTNSVSITFNTQVDPKLTNTTPTWEMINLTDPVSWKIYDDWAWVDSGTIVVVLSGTNDAASGYRHVFSGSQLNLTAVNGSANTPDYTYNITDHVSFPENGRIEVRVYAKDSEGNGKSYSAWAAGIGTYTFTARPSCSEFQCCDDNIHIIYANVNIQSWTSVLYTWSSLTIVWWSGSLSGNEFFNIIWDTWYLNCGVSVAWLTFHSRKISNTRGENGFTDTWTIVWSGNGTFIVQSGDDLILWYMKDHVGLTEVQPDSTHYVTDVNSINIGWKLIWSTWFANLLWINDPSNIDLWDGWLYKYIVSVEIPATFVGEWVDWDPILYTAEVVSDQYDISNVDLDLLLYTTHLCTTWYTWSYGENKCTIVATGFTCGENQVVVNGQCVCSEGYANDQEWGCTSLKDLNNECGNKYWNGTECVEMDNYCTTWFGADVTSVVTQTNGGWSAATDPNGASVAVEPEQEENICACPAGSTWKEDLQACVSTQEWLMLISGHFEEYKDRFDCWENEYFDWDSCRPAGDLGDFENYCVNEIKGTLNQSTYDCECNTTGWYYYMPGKWCTKDWLDTNRWLIDWTLSFKWYLDTYTGVVLDWTYTVKVRVVDIEKRVSDPLTYSFMIDTTPPLCSISTTQSYMCTGGNDLTLTMTWDMTEWYSFMWSTDNTWTSGTQLTGSISTWWLYTWYVKDSAWNTWECKIEITNPGVEISDYTLSWVYTWTITVTGLIEKMNILEWTWNENCGTGNITLSISDCVDGVVTWVISNTDTLTITLSGGVEHLDSSTTSCTVVATDLENTAKTADIYFAFDTLAPACTMAIDNTECEDKVSLETLAKCEDWEEYNSDLGLCVPSCNWTLHEKGNNEYLCCPAGTLFDGSVCKDRWEFDCSDDELIVSINWVTQCKSAENMNVDDNMICAGSEQPNMQDPTVPAQASEETERDCSCKAGYSLYYQNWKFSCKPDTAICEEWETWNGSYCDMCGDWKMYITSTILETINSDYKDDFDIEKFDGAWCYEESLFIDCHGSEVPICYGSNLPIVVTVQDGRSPIATYQWHKPSGVFGWVSVDGNVPSLVVSETWSYKLTVVDEYGNEGECLPALEITWSRLDMIAPIVTANDISGYECQIITWSVSVTDEWCAWDWTYRWYDTTGLISGVTTWEYWLYQTVTWTETRDVVVADILGNQAITGTVSYTWEDLPLYINTWSYALGTMLPEKWEVDEYVVPVPSTWLDVIDLFEAQEMSGDVTCGVWTGITLDSFACDLEFVTWAIDETTWSIVNIIVWEYASATWVSCTWTISDDDGNSTWFELTFDVGREWLIIWTPESVSVTAQESTDIVIKMPWFRVEDKRWWDTWYYTTIQSKWLFNISNGTNVAVRIESDHGSSWLLMLTDGTLNGTTVNSALWDDNWGVTFDNTSDPVLYFYRANNSDNWWVKNRYEDELDLFVQNIAAGTYTGEIVFTLYDRPFQWVDNAWVYWNESQWLISVITPFSSSGHGATITIMDKNLWATSTDINSTDSYGYYYQWWNNYGFANAWTLSTSSNLVSYPSAPYSGTTFVLGGVNGSWISGHPPYLWWVDWNWNIVNTWYRQWPCPEWYHVPGSSDLIVVYRAVRSAYDSSHSGWENTLLKMPTAWYRSSETSNVVYNEDDVPVWYYWTNQSNGWYGSFYLKLQSWHYIMGSDSTTVWTANWFSVRCMKDTAVDPVWAGWVRQEL